MKWYKSDMSVWSPRSSAVFVLRYGYEVSFETRSCWSYLFTYLAVFICPTKKENFPPAQSHKPSQNITRCACVCVAYVWLVVDIINGCCYLKRSFPVVSGSGRCSQYFAVTRESRAAETPLSSFCWILVWKANRWRWHEGSSQVIARYITPALPQGCRQDGQNYHSRESHDTLNVC